MTCHNCQPARCKCLACLIGPDFTDPAGSLYTDPASGEATRPHIEAANSPAQQSHPPSPVASPPETVYENPRPAYRVGIAVLVIVCGLLAWATFGV